MANQNDDDGHQEQGKVRGGSDLPGWVGREVYCVIKDMKERAVGVAEDRKLGYIEAVIDMERMFKDRGFDV